MTGRDVILVGSKPYVNLDLSPYIDLFGTNIVRFNWMLPGQNNGVNYGELFLCSHIYQFGFLNRLGIADLLKIYGNEVDNDYLKNNYDRWLQSLAMYKKVYFQEARTAAYNNFLNALGCPYEFISLPRGGALMVMEKMMRGYNVYLSNFSILDEVRVSGYAHKNHRGNETVHDRLSEINILQWLHVNAFVDASLCLLDDNKNVSFNSISTIKPTSSVIQLISSFS